MGQYYNIVMLFDDHSAENPHGEYFSPVMLKLMEHSWIGNDNLLIVENLLRPGGRWYKSRIVWPGDYGAAEGPDISNLYHLARENFEVCNESPLTIKQSATLRYIVNHDKKLYVDKDALEPEVGFGGKIHPLPLLTWETNGGGGGDFRGSDPEYLCGSWARDHISMEAVIPQGYTQLKFDLHE